MLILGSIFSCIDPIFSIASSLAFKDGFYLPLNTNGKETLLKKKELDLNQFSDHIVLSEALIRFGKERQPGKFCESYFLSFNTLKLLLAMKRQFCCYLLDLKFLLNRDSRSEFSNINSNNIVLIKAIVCASLYPNMAKLRYFQKTYYFFFPKSIMF